MRRFEIDKRYLAPVLVTIVLIVGQITFGFLESWSRTALAIGVAILVEIVLGRLLGGKWPHLASAYISGISIGMLVRSPEFWPYALCSAISITSKYVIRVDGRHIWNPSNLGIVAMLVLASDTVASLSVQWGNTLLPMVVVWAFGSVIIHALGRFHITLTYVVSFVAFSVVRALVTGHPWAADGRGVCRRGGRGGVPAAAVRARAVLRALHRRPDGKPDRDRAGAPRRGARRRECVCCVYRDANDGTEPVQEVSVAERDVIANQKSILKNQTSILANQKKIQANQTKILANQTKVLGNQKKLDAVLANQKDIKANQATIIGNQKTLLAR
jgi:hypothetical protein